MTDPKLNQVLAIEKGVKSRAYSTVTELHKLCQKPTLFQGLSRIYDPKDESGEVFPPESAIVQAKVPDILKKAQKILTELFDITLTKDAANQEAKSDIVVNGNTLAKDVPATTLLFLEKQLSDLHTFVSKLPVLDPSEQWSFDEPTGLWKTSGSKTQRTKKVSKPIVLYQATKEHPAQTQLITEDEVVGYWNQVKSSGATTGHRREQILERVEQLTKAVKYAREQANCQEAPKKHLGDAVLGFLFA